MAENHKFSRPFGTWHPQPRSQRWNAGLFSTIPPGWRRWNPSDIGHLVRSGRERITRSRENSGASGLFVRSKRAGVPRAVWLASFQLLFLTVRGEKKVGLMRFFPRKLPQQIQIACHFQKYIAADWW